MGSQRKWAASLMMASVLSGGGSMIQAIPIPPGVVRTAKDAGRAPIPDLLLGLYEIQQEKYDKLLGIQDMAPVEPNPTDKIEIFDIITDEPKRKRCCRELGVDPARVKK